MHYLSYRTRGQTEPNGKPNVYFCAHPQDHDLYLDSICKEILDKQNCAVWYRSGDPTLDDDVLFDLSQMQMFVIPVTTRLLTTNNRALQEEYPVAIANHIPILPLMQESGLERLFANTFGDLQFLDRYQHDLTAIPYEAKLANFLSSSLIGDELAEQVRAAFRAHIFLSYRKKDRKYARELMNLIHQYPFSKDIAIWFDEFLIP